MRIMSSGFGRARFDPDLGQRPGVVEQPAQRGPNIVRALSLLQIPINVFDRRLQAVQRALEVFQCAAPDDDVISIQPVGGGQLAGDVGLLAAPGSAELAWTARTASHLESAAAPPAPLRHG